MCVDGEGGDIIASKSDCAGIEIQGRHQRYPGPKPGGNTADNMNEDSPALTLT